MARRAKCAFPSSRSPRLPRQTRPRGRRRATGAGWLARQARLGFDGARYRAIEHGFRLGFQPGRQFRGTRFQRRAVPAFAIGFDIGASQAEDWGLIYKAVDDEALIGEARALAEKLANGPTLAYATMKKNIATAMDGTITEVLLAEAEGQRLAGASKDAMEGGMAFLQKRKPDFKGE